MSYIAIYLQHVHYKYAYACMISITHILYKFINLFEFEKFEVFVRVRIWKIICSRSKFEFEKNFCSTHLWFIQNLVAKKYFISRLHFWRGKTFREFIRRFILDAWNLFVVGKYNGICSTIEICFLWIKFDNFRKDEIFLIEIEKRHYYVFYNHLNDFSIR